MSLEPATRLGSYEIVALLGKGGMGEVYRARDARLHRDVAIKILPASVSGDPERRARFEREARAVAALSHPNILAVHEFGAHEGRLFVVMELLEGQTLRDLLQSGQMPLRKTIDVAIQIARGLAAAHQKNLIHRDLKPENIFVLRDGQVKILDFGLARSLTAASDAGAAETIAETDPGTVLGTVGYMSPEQVRGEAADARADLFALGAVLFEMLSGRRAFQRETAAETMTAVLREHPPELVGSRADLPPAIDRIVQHALEKDPQARFQTASDVVFALTSLSGSGVASSGAVPTTTVPAAGAGRSRLVPALLAALVLAAMAGAAGWAIGRRPQPVDARWDHFTQLTDAGGQEHAPTISPDGSSFAYVSRARGSWDVYVQRVGGRNPLLVAGDPARQEAWPKFSPDGRQIAFSEMDADGGIFITGATGESERRLTVFGGNPAWSPDGKQIAFATETVDLPYSRANISQLWVVDLTGGAPRKIHDEDAVQPKWSPSGKRIAFWAVVGGQRDLATVAADGRDRVAVTKDAALDWGPEWSPDGRWLYFASDRGGFMGLWRIAMDEATGRPTGQPEPVSAGVEATMDLPSFSSDGRVLLFRSQLDSVNPAAIPFDPAAERAGVPRLLTTRTGILLPASVSPDGEWVALSNLGERQEDLFVMRRDGGDLRRLTDDAARDRGPRWTPDGTALVFYSNRSGSYAIWSIRPDGSGLTMLAERRPGLLYGAMSPLDGRLSAASDWNTESYFVTAPFPATPERIQPLPNSATATGYLSPTLWSPDGKWLSGRWMGASGEPAGVAVYDIAAGRARKVTSDRGLWVAPFLPDSRRLLYFTADSELVVVEISQGSRRVIPVTLPLPAAREAVAIAPDGRTIYYGAQQIESNVWKVERAGSR
ncbi:MAG TPA: protein kinase [Vicinamibacterales bacterium]|nr:protein kinase [Vicinamibacterales bacterium]